ncbi:MAG: hypothetical protein ABIT76_13315 [Chthoniobacterales bacterium]
MNEQIPPPLPISASPWRTYLYAFALLFPSLAIWRFTLVFLFPKMEQVWKLAGLTHSKAQWLMDTSYALSYHGRILLYLAVALLIVMERYYKAWPRYRSPVVMSLTLLFYIFVLVTVTMVSTTVLLAAPLLTRAH